MLIELKPDFLEPLVNLACAYIELSRYDEAISVSRRALEVEPDCLEAHDCLGVALFKNGDRETGLNQLAIMEKLNPAFEGDLKKLGSPAANHETPD